LSELPSFLAPEEKKGQVRDTLFRLPMEQGFHRSPYGMPTRTSISTFTPQKLAFFLAQRRAAGNEAIVSHVSTEFIGLSDRSAPPVFA
jgi:hypothetical protein